MSTRSRLLGAAAGAAVAGGAAVGVARIVTYRRLAHLPAAGDQVPLGSLRSPAITVHASDGVPLHAEVDEYEPPPSSGRRRRKGLKDEPPFTLVFIHGFCLDLDCWHFQRAAYRGLVKTVYYDQRSHGQSARSDSANTTIEQLGSDLKQVLDDLTNDEPVVLIGHSMGGMTIMALAEQHPELFGTKVAGLALISTTGGEVDPSRILLPMVPTGIGSGVLGRTVRALRFGHRVVDSVRNFGEDIALTMTDVFAFGSQDVPEEYLRFTYQMVAETPYETVADFYPTLTSMDKWSVMPVLSRVPTAIITGTADKMIPVERSRKLHAKIGGSDLLECPDAGHLVLIERHEDVNHELDSLMAHVFERMEP